MLSTEYTALVLQAAKVVKKLYLPDFLQNALPEAFYLREDVTRIARELLGKLLFSNAGGQLCAVRITETEAYRAPDDRACHAWGNRLTSRTRVMFGPGGRAYVYLCYGIHHLFNVVTAPAGMAHAVLIRAGEPVWGQEAMLARRFMRAATPRLCSGPGALTQALGLRYDAHNAASLLSSTGEVWIGDDGYLAPEPLVSKRVGVEYAGPDAERLWRFLMPGTAFVSRKP